MAMSRLNTGATATNSRIAAIRMRMMTIGELSCQLSEQGKHARAEELRATPYKLQIESIAKLSNDMLPLFSESV
jgi:hypothetical protein